MGTVPYSPPQIAPNYEIFCDTHTKIKITKFSLGGRWAKCAKGFGRLINIFLCMSQIGSNAVYILFVAQNIMPVRIFFKRSFSVIMGCKSVHNRFKTLHYDFCITWVGFRRQSNSLFVTRKFVRH